MPLGFVAYLTDSLLVRLSHFLAELLVVAGVAGRIGHSAVSREQLCRIPTDNNNQVCTLGQLQAVAPQYDINAIYPWFVSVVIKMIPRGGVGEMGKVAK